MTPPALRLAAPALALLVVLVAACSSGDAEESKPPPGGPVSRNDPDAGTTDPGKVETEIVFGADATFAKRSCSLTLRYAGAAGEVKLAGEFTDWATSPLSMTQASGGFEITLEPSAKLEAGKLYGYKLIADGQWKIDPGGRYRKIVGSEMNSGLKLPTCAAGPELAAGKVEATSNGADGTMKVRVSALSASDGDKPAKVKASLDRGAVPQGSWKVDDAAGAVDFDLPKLAKGKHTLSLRLFDAKGREAEPIDLPFWIEDEAFDWRDGVLYMFMIDRFANGDKANDKPVGGPVHYDADWHGGDLAGALDVLKTGYFEKLGVRTIWISPVNAQTDAWQIGDGGQVFSAYHGYWPVKARAVESRFGGDAALRAFVAEAHTRGLRVVIDLINNQVHKDHEYVAPHAQWFRQSCQCGDNAAGCGWSQRPFDCMFQPYLPDIDWNKADAEKQFISDAVNWIAEFDLDGFRVDAVKHVEANSVYNMRAELGRRFEQGGARVFMVGETAVGEGDSGTFFGETFANGFAWIDAYTGPTALDGQFDFPTRHNMADGLVNGLKPLNEVEDQIKKAETTYKPQSRHVRFLNGHDNPRIASIAAQDPKLGCAWTSGCRDDQLPPLSYSDPAVYEKLKRALTVLYTMGGIPYLYMGDEVAFAGGGDPDMRRDMRFGDPALASVEMSKPSTTPAALTSQQTDLRGWVRKLGAARNASKALRRGDRKTLVGTEADFWAYAFQTGPKEVALVVINRGGAVSGRSIPANGLSLGSVTGWTTAVGSGTATTTGGNLTISLGAGEAAVFVAK